MKITPIITEFLKQSKSISYDFRWWIIMICTKLFTNKITKNKILL